MSAIRPLLVVTCAAASWLAAAGRAAPPDHKLKPGGRGVVCLECHTDIEALLKKPVVHTPVREKNCVGCHNPHASEFDKLLSAKGSEVCTRCHADVVPAAAKSAHAPVRDQGCSECHVAHAGEHKNNLKEPPRALCGRCHATLVAAAEKARFQHKPVKSGGCAVCHDPHGSARAGHLLKDPVPALCAKCHATTNQTFVRKHLGYPVAKAECTSCHDPHGSDQKGILNQSVHPPMAKGMCGQCHQAASSDTPLATKRQGNELCRSCHLKVLDKIGAQNRQHSPVLAGKGCLNCHSPHASSGEHLVRGNMVVVCGNCHADTVARHERSPTAHPPVRDGKCTSCHSPHGGNDPLLFKQADTLELCGACHNWQKHATHPIGPDKRDPRNANLTLTCLSCHRAHGTEYAKLIPAPTVSALCTQCHTEYRR